MLLIPLLALAAPQAMPPMDHVANHAAAVCPATPAPPPPGLKGWTRRQPARAGATAAAATPLTIGTGVTATLLPTPQVTYPVAPRKPGIATSSGGLFAFDVASAGRYRVALGAGAWIDVLSGTTPATAVAHGHGPGCSGIGKMVEFDLTSGRYLLQIAGNATATLPLIVARVP